MSITHVRVKVATDGSGLRRVSLVCGCASVGRYLAEWEALEEAVRDLELEHRATAPTCPHRAPWSQDPR